MTIEFTAHPGAASYRVENGCGAAFPGPGRDLAGRRAPAWYGAGDSVVGARALRWTRSTGGRAPDAQLVSTIWIEEGEVSENGIYLLAPPDLTEVELPALPDGYAEYAPIDPGDIDVQVIGAESSRFDGYRAARQRGFEIVRDDAVLLGEPPIASTLSGGPNAEP